MRFLQERPARTKLDGIVDNTHTQTRVRTHARTHARELEAQLILKGK
jgi:hypothetical protein